MFEESVCLLLRAAWFQPLKVENHVEHEDAYDPIEDFYQYRYDYEYDDEDDDDLDEVYYGSSSSLRIGNRRWGDNGYVRSGRLEARPVPQVHHLASQKRKRQLKKSQQVDGLRGH
ncbi:hypothetical protein HN51_049606 [Arachis hypogaea]|uniref:Uncharacterized protein n=1 Tax=Arachis hypogaea TaxID=3818 RepID=A0A444YEK9_ARAHY|nr:hypothetical protein Ahy_B07g088480 [Arachis hypogaea]